MSRTKSLRAVSKLLLLVVLVAGLVLLPAQKNVSGNNCCWDCLDAWELCVSGCGGDPSCEENCADSYDCCATECELQTGFACPWMGDGCK